MQKQTNEEYLNVNEAAAFTKMHEQTFRRLAREGQIPAFKVGGRWRFNKNALAEWTQKDTSNENKIYNVLIVDDEEKICSMISRTLQKKGFETHSSLDGYQAFEIASTIHFDILILDLNMSGINGAQTLKAFREKKLHMPVIILTGYPESKLITKMLP